MNYILCHKDINVLNLEILNDEVYAINEIYNDEHVPLFLKSQKTVKKVSAFREWWKGRCIPSSRQNLDKFLSEIAGLSLNSLIIKSMGLSLSDQYWIKPENSHLKWKDVNFYTNDFSPDVGNLFFGKNKNVKINFISPDNTSDGWLLKKWIIENGKRLLIKGGSGPYEQEPFNEVLASEICRKLKIPHIDYDIVKIGNDYFCSCGNLTDENTELVSAWNVINTQKQEKKQTDFEHLLSCCRTLKIGSEEKLKNDIAKMILLDFIMANTDRHYSNFCFLRNSNTLEWLGLSPIFDTGTSMFNKVSTEELKYPQFTDSKNIEAKPFFTRQYKQLERFSTIIALQNLDFDSLNDIPEYFTKLLSENKKISDERRRILASTLSSRIEQSRNIVYRKNEIVKEFLRLISSDEEHEKELDKISYALTQMTSKDNRHKRVLDNYLKILKPKDEIEMVQKVMGDVNLTYKKNRTKTGVSISD